MTFKQLEDLAAGLRAEGDGAVPSSRRWDGEKRVRLDVDGYRAALAAHLSIDLSSVQHAGSEARSRDHVEEMLGALERHVAEHRCAPLQR